MQKDPNLLMIIYEVITNSATWQGAVMASFIAVLRVLYDEKETKLFRVLLEALICGSLSLCITSIVDVSGLPQSAAITIGGAIGFLGVTTLRDFLLRIIDKRVDK